MVSLEYFYLFMAVFQKTSTYYWKKNIKDNQYKKRLIFCLKKMSNIYAIMVWM